MIILATPEYAHGVSGVLKNALDWLVSDYSLLGKPISFPNVSTRATIAQSHLREILTTMGFSIIESCSPRATLEKPLADAEVSPENALKSNLIAPQIKSLWLEIQDYLSTK